MPALPTSFPSSPALLLESVSHMVANVSPVALVAIVVFLTVALVFATITCMLLIIPRAPRSSPSPSRSRLIPLSPIVLINPDTLAYAVDLESQGFSTITVNTLLSLQVAGNPQPPSANLIVYPYLSRVNADQGVPPPHHGGRTTSSSINHASEKV